MIYGSHPFSVFLLFLRNLATATLAAGHSRETFFLYQSLEKSKEDKIITDILKIFIVNIFQLFSV